MSTILAQATLMHSQDGLTLAPDGFAFDGTHAYSANAYSVPIMIITKDTLALQVSCPAGGAPAGAVTIQGTNDISLLESTFRPDTALVNWSTLSFWDEAAAAWASSKTVAGAQSYMLTIPIIGVRWFRMLWTNTSGSANLTARVQIKGDGGR